MSAGKTVLVSCVYDQGDILPDFIDWHLHLGVDFILIQDFGSTDGSRELLDRLSKDGRVAWFTLPERDMTKYRAGDAMAEMARDTYQADWIILCDADEFLCPRGADLKTILHNAEASNLSMLSVPCLNMTGPALAPGQSAPEALTLRIDKPAAETDEQKMSGKLDTAYIFNRHPPHTIVRALAFQTYAAGAHDVTLSSGKKSGASQLHFLHYCIRGYDKFETKVRHTERWLDDNKHLQFWWAWHWRRWIRLMHEGRLREDYESQFVSPERAEILIRTGICTRDKTVADWLKRRNSGQAASL